MRDTLTKFVALTFLALLGINALIDIGRAQKSENGRPLNTNAKPDRVTYTSFRPGNWDIYLFKQTGQAPQRLTTDPGLDYDPVVSPDGRWLVFCSERRGNPDLYALDLKRGGEPRLLIESDAMEDQAVFSPDGKSIAFVSTLSDNADIYLLPFRPDKTVALTEARNLTRHPGGDFRPAFSPDGRKLAFCSDRDAVVTRRGRAGVRSGDIYVLDLADQRLQRLTDAPDWDGSPSWSSDGKTIAFYSRRGLIDSPTSMSAMPVSAARIWAMNADGSNQRVLTPKERLALSPEFLPDGRIVYSRNTKEGLWQLVSINADGADERIESDASQNSYWKPTRGPSTGAIVAHGSTAPGVPQGRPTTPASTFAEGPFLVPGAPFRKKLPDREIELYPIRYFTAILNPAKDLLLLTHPVGATDLLLSRLDGSGQQKIFQFDRTQNFFAGPGWSRDGEWIVFTRGSNPMRADTESDVWKMRADGSELQNLTPDSLGNDSYPSISRDGKQVVFRSGRSGSFDLYLMNADGSNVRRLTDDTADEFFPIFSPAADQIAFVSNRDTPGQRIYEVYLLDLKRDGTPGELRRVTHNDVSEGHLAFSYDGKWLIFSSEQGGISDEEPLVQSVVFAGQMYGEMYAYHIQDGTTVRLTHNKWEEGVPSWEAPLPSQRDKGSKGQK